MMNPQTHFIIWCVRNYNEQSCHGSLMCLKHFPPLSFMCWWCLLVVQPSLCQVCAALVSLSLCLDVHLAHTAQWSLCCRPERIDLRLHISVHTDVVQVNITTRTCALGSLDPTHGSNFCSRSRLTLFVNIKDGWACLRLDLERSNKFSDKKQMED